MRFLLLCLFAIVGLSFMHATPRSTAAEPSSASGAARWAIALHGGAGSDSAKWPEERRAARLAGLERALERGRSMLAEKAKAVDVVEQVIRVLEDDSYFNAGRGAVLTADGTVELDASIMDGSTRACGAVAGVTTAKNPITLARRVMTETRHVLLIGPGADRFGAAQEVDQVAPDYFISWQRRNDEVAPDRGESGREHLGTVGCVVLDQHGNLAAGTSTGGVPGKMPGRVGDSPIVGAGTYAANGLAAMSGTGVGEEYIRHAAAYDVVAQMRYADRTLHEAVAKVIDETLPRNSGGMIAMGADGTIVLRHNTPGMSCGAADSRGRFEVLLAVPDSRPESASR